MKQSKFPKNITIYDIAKEAGVSIATVSRVMNQPDHVKTATRKHVQQVIEKYNFSPSQVARSMVSKKNHTVGILLPEIRNPFFAQIVDEIDELLYKEGYTILLYNCRYSKKREQKAIDELLSRQVDGLILLSTGLDSKGISRQIEGKLPTVAVQSNVTGTDSIKVTDKQAFFTLTEHLLKKGHKRVACVGGNILTGQLQERVDGYRDAMQKHSISQQESYIHTDSQGSSNYGFEATQDLLSMQQRPTAIMAVNDYTATEVYSAVTHAGLRVGEDVAVTGFDNTSMSSLLSPQLTTVDYSIQLMAEMTAGFLTKRMLENDTSPPKTVHLPGEVILRASSEKEW